ncbi:MAG TPA: M28 family peptidase, partial [Vicinamibacterales bacterium]|nr:M28 family peptidase [Vicinamibacterales bacterium]
MQSVDGGRSAVAVIPGKSDEVMILDAHADAWFDGAGDNGDGLSVLIALARHFAKPVNKPDRTLVLIASAGHHTPGINGPRGFLAANPELGKRAMLAVNIEHGAQRNFAPGRSVAPDGYRDFVADSGEAPITAGVTNESPYLDTVIDRGGSRYGTNFVSAKSPMASGESGGFAP